MPIRTLIVLVSTSFMAKPGLAMITTHIKCRGGLYPRSNVPRYPVPDDKMSWSSKFEAYSPANHTADSIHGMPWADPNIDDPNFKPKWNSVDGNVSRVSYMGNYQVVNGLPLNPIGRTGIVGRGVLGRWGPNHAADPVVTRWKRLENGEVVIQPDSKRPILQFVAIQRGDTGEWALPGGMVDPGEKVSATAIREFQEEAINSLTMTEAEKQAWQSKFAKLFSEGTVVYRGYIDDPRNTDNAWMESVAYSFHDDAGDAVGSLRLQAGDDARNARWVDVARGTTLYASHKRIVEMVAERLQADL